MIRTEECRRGVSGSSHQKVAGQKVCHSCQRDDPKAGYHSCRAGYCSSSPKGVNGVVRRTGGREGGYSCPFPYFPSAGRHFRDPAYTLPSTLLLRELLIRSARDCSFSPYPWCLLVFLVLCGFCSSTFPGCIFDSTFCVENFSKPGMILLPAILIHSSGHRLGPCWMRAMPGRARK